MSYIHGRYDDDFMGRIARQIIDDRLSDARIIINGLPRSHIGPVTLAVVDELVVQTGETHLECSNRVYRCLEVGAER